MTGPEHYREAEQLLEDAQNADPDANPADVAMLIQFAQVHATLANAAATVELVFAYRVARDMGRTPSTENWAVSMAPRQ